RSCLGTGQRLGVWTHRRGVFEEPQTRGEGAQELLRRQPVHQPEVHRRDGGRASVRWLQHVRHRFKGRRSRLSAAVCAGQVHRGEGRLSSGVILMVPRIEGDQLVTTLGSNQIDTTNGRASVLPFSFYRSTNLRLGEASEISAPCWAGAGDSSAA